MLAPGVVADDLFIDHLRLGSTMSWLATTRKGGCWPSAVLVLRLKTLRFDMVRLKLDTDPRVLRRRSWTGVGWESSAEVLTVEGGDIGRVDILALGSAAEVLT